MKKRLFIYLGVISFFYSSCNIDGIKDSNTDATAIASVRGETLYKADLDKVVSSITSDQDSASTAQAYIKMWVVDQLMYDKAKQNIVNESDIEELVDDYRRSLITNFYQEQLLKEHFSKSLSEKDLQTYFEANKEMFKLKDNIIKGLYIKVPVESKQLSNFQKWYKIGTAAAAENIEKNALQNVVAYEYFYDRWVSFDDVIQNIPRLITEEQQFLKTNNSIEVSDSSFVYMLHIKDYRLAGSEPPFEYIKPQLAETYIEQRKAAYLKQVQQDLYNKAISNKEIKFYKE